MARSGTDGAEKLRALSKDLRRQADGKERAKLLRRELRDVAKPYVPQLRSAIHALPSHGESARRGRMSLRAQLARSVTLQVRTSGRRAGVSIFMSPRKMPSGMKALPMYMEATPGYTRWQHPVYGHDAWVTQRPHPYFTRTTQSVDRMVGRAANRVVEATAKDLEKN
jgi:hypothetical protein